MADYIPKRDALLVSWATNFYNQINSHVADWNFTAIEVAKIQDALNEFAGLVLRAESPESNHPIVVEKDKAREKLVTMIRELVGYKLRNPVITDVQRSELGITVYSKVRKKVEKPTKYPRFTIKVVGVRQLEVDFYNEDTGTKARPYGYNGAVISFDVLDAPPSSPEELRHTVLATRTPHLFEFEEKQRGKIVYFAIQWQNEKGERGPYSAIQSAYIP
jgi:hypothetical protein